MVYRGFSDPLSPILGSPGPGSGSLCANCMCVYTRPGGCGMSPPPFFFHCKVHVHSFHLLQSQLKNSKPRTRTTISTSRRRAVQAHDEPCPQPNAAGVGRDPGAEMNAFVSYGHREAIGHPWGTARLPNRIDSNSCIIAVSVSGWKGYAG